MWDDETLVRAIQNQDQDAFAELVNCYTNSMYSAAWRILKNKELAEEVVQETMLKFWKKPTWRPGGAALKSWLYGMTTNTAIDVVRSNKRKTAVSLNAMEERTQEQGVHLDLAISDDRAEQLCEQDALQNVVHGVLRSLPDRQQQVLVLRYFEQLSQKDTAFALKISTKAVESLVARAKRTMKLTLKEKGINVEDLL